ncbi:MAG: FAD-dependent oxidoreductase [Deltaproteobacteria bacterium]|nr:FAD-dependent oxidoreductase [Deltaproteobacteria bacterium]
MATLAINGITVTADEGATILEAAESAGINIPTLCRHRAMLPTGACRICMVRIEDARGPRLVASCVHPVQDGLKVETDTDDVREARRMVAELMLARCPDNAAVKEIARQTGVADAAWADRGEPDDCVLCGRCVEVCHDVMKVGAIDFNGRGSARTVRAPFDEASPVCQQCGACAFVCPTGKIRPDGLWGHRPGPLREPFEEGLGCRPTINRPFPSAVPSIPAIDRGNCVHFKTGQCGVCQKVCPAGAIDYDEAARERTLEVGAVVLSPGFRRFDPSGLGELGFGRFPNVVTSIQFERILSASGPTMGVVKRPSDGAHPRKIAFLQCVGSRDRRTHVYCSAFCCMQATKEAMIAREHDRGIDPTIFFMDIRAFGKGFESYFNRARTETGVRYVRSQVSSVKEVLGSRNLLLSWVDPVAGRRTDGEFDMLVLSVGAEPSPEGIALARKLGVALDEHGFCRGAPFEPVGTGVEGVYVTGMFSGPKDIPETVSQASAAAGAVASYLHEARGTEVSKREYPLQKDVASEEPRVGVFVCHCGINIAGTVKVEEVEKFARTLPGVAHVERSLFTCSQDSQQNIKKRIAEKGLNRVVVASCTPRTHEPIFQETLREAALNPYLFEMANIREHCAWVHQAVPDEATVKAMELVAMTVAKARMLGALQTTSIPVHREAIVVGAGIAGMTAALSLSGQGFVVHLVEREGELGGLGRRLRTTLRGGDVRAHATLLSDAVKRNDRIRLHTGAAPVSMGGHIGRFELALSTGAKVEGGVIVVATGGREHKPAHFLHGEHPRVLTQLEIEERGGVDVPDGGNIVMIQCVGSRVPERGYCSRVCCSQAVKNALAIKKKHPRAGVTVLYRDIRTYGLYEEAYRAAREAGVVFLRFEEDRQPDVASEGDRLSVIHHDAEFGANVMIAADWLVLSAAVEALPENRALGEVLKVPVMDDGFFLEAHAKLRPADFASEGIFVAGLAHGPKNADESIAQALAAAGRAGIILSHDTIEANAVVSRVDEEKCISCLTCVRICPYDAPAPRADGTVEIPAVKCQGCGLCAAACPGKAIQLGKFKDEQVEAMITAFGGRQ